MLLKATELALLAVRYQAGDKTHDIEAASTSLCRNLDLPIPQSRALTPVQFQRVIMTSK